MDADLKNHINKGFKTFEVFSKLKDFVDDIEAIETKSSEQRAIIAKSQSVVDELMLRKESLSKEIRDAEATALSIIEEAKREALEIVEKAKDQKSETVKKEKELVEKSRAKLLSVQVEIDSLSKEMVPLRHERDTIMSEIEIVKDKFRKMI